MNFELDIGIYWLEKADRTQGGMWSLQVGFTLDIVVIGFVSLRKYEVCIQRLEMVYILMPSGCFSHFNGDRELAAASSCLENDAMRQLSESMFRRVYSSTQPLVLLSNPRPVPDTCQLAVKSLRKPVCVWYCYHRHPCLSSTRLSARSRHGTQW